MYVYCSNQLDSCQMSCLHANETPSWLFRAYCRRGGSCKIIRAGHKEVMERPWPLVDTRAGPREVRLLPLSCLWNVVPLNCAHGGSHCLLYKLLRFWMVVPRCTHLLIARQTLYASSFAYESCYLSIWSDCLFLQPPPTLYQERPPGKPIASLRWTLFSTWHCPHLE